MSPVHHQVRLAARPSGLPARSDWELTTEPVPVPGPGQFVVAVSYLSIDPAMRRWIDTAYREPVAIGAVMEAGAIGRVTASQHPGFAVGEHVYGGFGVQEFARSDGTGVTKLDPLLAALPAYLGALGITGLTAYFGLLDVARLSETDTVVVSVRPVPSGASPAEDRGKPPAVFRRTGVFELEQVDVQAVEGPGRLDDRVFAGLAAKIFPWPLVHKVLDHHRDTRRAAVADDFFTHGQGFGDQVRLPLSRGRAVGAQLDERT